MLSLRDIANTPLPAGTKGLPLDGSIARPADLTGRGLNVLRGDFPMPVAVLKRSALDNNLRVMQDYIDRTGVELAPHAKTTLCPELFARQLNHGCWGLSVATMTQFKLCHDLEVERVLLANQLVGGPEIAGLAQLWAQTPNRIYYVLVDSIAAAEQISAGFSRVAGAPPARVLIEMGVPNGRCGVRSLDEGLTLARAIRALPHIELHGVEGYEGLFVSDNADHDTEAVSNYLAHVLQLYRRLLAENLFADPKQIIVSAGGSAYYDLVAKGLTGQSSGVVPILRSGCYLTHDSGFYRRLVQRMDDRSAAGPAPRLVPALEVWSRVISRPQPDQAIVILGKRDVSYDIDLPMPRWWFRDGHHGAPLSSNDFAVTKLNDQHAYLQIRASSDLAVGDLLGFEISHPCTTFDKWSLLLEVEDDYTVHAGLKTFF
jgi:D-serine deaminase-like pyridoxal phosphate-dependent protein